MSCSLTDALIDARLLEVELAAEQRSHLEDCAGCRRALEELDELAAPLQAIAAPAGFAARVMARLPERPAPTPRASAPVSKKATPKAPVKAVSGRQLHRRRGRTRLGLAALAAFALCGAAAWSLAPEETSPRAPRAQSAAISKQEAPKPRPRIVLPRIDVPRDPVSAVGAAGRRVLKKPRAERGGQRKGGEAGSENPRGPVLPAIKGGRPKKDSEGASSASQRPKLPPPPEPKDEVDASWIFAWDYRLGSLDPSGIEGRDDLLARFIARGLFQSSLEIDLDRDHPRSLVRALAPGGIAPGVGFRERSLKLIREPRSRWVFGKSNAHDWRRASGGYELMRLDDLLALWSRRDAPPRRAEHPLYDGAHPRYLAFLSRLRGEINVGAESRGTYMMLPPNPTSWLALARILDGAPFLITRRSEKSKELLSSTPRRLKVIRGEDGYLRELRLELSYDDEDIDERVRFVAVDISAIDPADYDAVISLPPKPARRRVTVKIDAQTEAEKWAATFAVARARHAVARRHLGLAGASKSYKLLDFPDAALTSFDAGLVAGSRLGISVGYRKKRFELIAEDLAAALRSLGYSAHTRSVARKATKNYAALTVTDATPYGREIVELMRFAAEERPITEQYFGAKAFDDRGYLRYPPELTERDPERLKKIKRAFAKYRR